MTREDREYFQRRADTERKRAQSATDPSAMRSHFILANHYLNKLQQQEEDAHAHQQTA